MKKLEEQILLSKNDIVLNSLSPLEKCWELRNYIGTLTGRYDVADEICAMICEIIKSHKTRIKMINKTDDNSIEYWEKTKNYILNGR